MDNLARNAMLAKEANMSYGRWKAMQPIVEMKKPEIPEGAIKCIGCGKVFVPSSPKQKYCDVTCQKYTYNKNHRIKRREQMRERRAKYGKG